MLFRWVLIFTFSPLIVITCHAQGVALDPEFSTDAFWPEHSYVRTYGSCAELTEDNEIIIAVNFVLPVSLPGDPSKIRVARFHSNGGLDTDFGIDGVALALEAALESNVADVVLQQDGKILILATSDYGIPIVVRLMPDGTVDNGFGTNGVVHYSNGSFHRSSSLILQPDGKIVVVCYNNGWPPAGDYYTLIYRLNNDGSADSSFAQSGAMTIDIGNDLGEFPSTAILLPDGKIQIFGGLASTIGDFKQRGHFIARLQPDGLLDSTFGDFGVLIDSLETDLYLGVRKAHLLSDGSIVTGGNAHSQDSSVACIAKFLPDGSLDHSFGHHGTRVLYVPEKRRGFITSIKVHEDGSVHYAGTARNDFIHDRFNFVGRICSDGTIDRDYSGPDGTREVKAAEIGGLRMNYDMHDVLLQSTGKLVAITDVYYGDDEGSAITPFRFQEALEPHRYGSDPFVYPNPIDASFILSRPKNSSAIERLDLVDVQGRVVYSFYEAIGRNSIQLNWPRSVPSGAYLLRIQEADAMETVKLLKQ